MRMSTSTAFRDRCDKPLIMKGKEDGLLNMEAKEWPKVTGKRHSGRNAA